jgi:DNA modification methylase
MHQLRTNPGDVVLSPFAGIGSELVTAIEMGRRAVGVELKRSYYEQAARNLQELESAPVQASLFDVLREAA